MRTTSSPAEGLLTVLLVTVPVIDSAKEGKRPAASKTATGRIREENNVRITFKVYVNGG
jgi:hypothetical protein